MLGRCLVSTSLSISPNHDDRSVAWTGRRFTFSATIDLANRTSSIAFCELELLAWVLKSPPLLDCSNGHGAGVDLPACGNWLQRLLDVVVGSVAFLGRPFSFLWGLIVRHVVSRVYTVRYSSFVTLVLGVTGLSSVTTAFITCLMSLSSGSGTL
ncbi:hypothetical protein CC86DRAFT_32805 [Ophiobolus disseminans]|uniref:Uncharacterized protein n=1 Tax=Ophiobolus disseminans TaxID=1469910 RepID=A0A6A6ZXK0_9PLEO|nr:hypothetical protein CC86DRAFT_32805 [Ophiobolus disseminans]